MEKVKRPTKKRDLVAFKSKKLIYLGDAQIKKIDLLTANQAKLAMLTASKVCKDDTAHKVYTISFAEFSGLCGFESAKNHEQIYQEIDKLSKLGVNFIDKNGHIIFFKWINEPEVIPHTGLIEYKLDSRLLPLYKANEELKQFAKVNLLDYMPLCGKYSVRLYEFIAMWANAGKVYQSVEQLREQLMVEPNKYCGKNGRSHFVKRCIVDPVAEINKHAQNAFTVDLVWDYTGSPQCKRVTGVTFIIKKIDSEYNRTAKPKRATAPKKPKTPAPVAESDPVDGGIKPSSDFAKYEKIVEGIKGSRKSQPSSK